MTAILSNLYKSVKPFLPRTTSDFICLEHPVTNDTFKTKNNGFCTILRLDGFYKILGENEFQSCVNNFARILRATFGRPGYGIQIVFDYDEDLTESEVKENFAPIIATSKRIGVDLEDMYEEQINTICQFCNYESLHIALYTDKQAVDSHVMSSELGPVAKADADLQLVVDVAGSPYYMETLLNVHLSFVQTFHQSMADAFYRIHILNIHEASNAIRTHIEPQVCTRKWKPKLCVDKYIPSVGLDKFKKNKKTLDVLDVLPPRVDTQVTTVPHIPVDKIFYKVAGDYCAALSVELFPTDPRPFNEFLSRCKTANIRFRASFNLSHGMSIDFSVASILNTFFGWAHGDNALFKQAQAMDHQKDAGGTKTEIGLQVCFVIKNSDIKSLQRDVNSFIKYYQLTGEGVVVQDTADPSEIHITSSVGASKLLPAVKGYPDDYDAAFMLPLMRSASFWSQGGIVFQTNDGKPWYWQPGSGQQESQMDMILAYPRQGKSVLSNAIQKAFCLKAGNAELPYCITMDIGKASFGFVDLLRESISEDKRNLLLTYTLIWSKDYAMNLLDIQLGCKAPHNKERQDILTFLMLYLSEPGEERPRDGLADCISTILDDAYSFYAAPETAKRYEPGSNTEIDSYMASDRDFSDIVVGKKNITWWDLRDRLFDKGQIRLATIASRYAVPIIPDLATRASESPLLEKMFGKDSVYKNVLGIVINKIAAGQNAFPIFNDVTKVDFANARVMAMDLQAGCGDLSAAGIKQTALTVLAARYHATRHLYMKKEEDAQFFEPRYRGYQERRLKEIADSEKRITYDEFHMYSPVQQVVAQVERDQRVGGKANMQICVITQVIRDLSDSIIVNCTNRFILGTVQQADIEVITQKIGLGESEIQLLKGNKLHGPKKGGSSLLYQFNIKDGRYSQFLKFAVGPIELWGYSTTNQDRIIRQKLYELIGPSMAKRFLAKKFPAGTAVPEVERMREQRGDDSSLIAKDEEQQKQQMAMVLADQLYKEFMLQNAEH